MKIVIRVLEGPGAGQFVKDFDPDGGDPAVRFPTGEGTYTPHVEEAMTFDSMESAYRFYRRPSTRTPRRPDGRPNRPMTRITVEIGAP